MTTDEAIKWSRSSFYLIQNSVTYTEAYHFYGYTWGILNTFSLLGVIEYPVQAMLISELRDLWENVKTKVGHN